MRLTVEDFSDYLEVPCLSDLQGPGNRVFRAPAEPAVPMSGMDLLTGEPRFRFLEKATDVPLRVAKVAHALCISPGIIIDANTGQLLPDFFRKPPDPLPEFVDIELTSAGFDTPPDDWHQATAIGAVRTEGSGAVYAASRFNGYGHVLLEAISRCWAFGQLRVVGRLVVANKAAHRHYYPWFRALGVDMATIRTTRRGPILVSDLLVPSQSYVLDRGMSPRFPAVPKRIADVLVEESGGTLQETPLYVSRRYASKRRLVTEAEVEALFAERGFRIMHPERHPLADQVRAFAAAPIVAGTVGSGLYNVAFSQPSTRLIVLAPDGFYTRNDMLLAGVRTHAPQYMFGTTEATTRTEGMLTDWHISPREVATALDRAL